MDVLVARSNDKRSQTGIVSQKLLVHLLAVHGEYNTAVHFYQVGFQLLDVLHVFLAGTQFVDGLEA